MNEVLVLHCALPAPVDAPSARALATRLPYAYRLELERRDAPARSASLTGLALVLRGATRLRNQAVESSRFGFPGGGKPYLDGGPSFSIAHCGSRVVVALSDACEVGVDVEEPGVDEGVEPVGPGIVGHSKVERWTATEAVLKAVGAGLRSFAQVELAPGLGTAQFGAVTIHLHPLSLAPGCVAHLATLADAVTVTVEEAAKPW